MSNAYKGKKKQKPWWRGKKITKLVKMLDNTSMKEKKKKQPSVSGQANELMN